MGAGAITGGTPWGAIAGAAGGLISAGVGIAQRASANKWLKHNQQPIEAIPREYLEGQGVANNMANTGLPSEQYNNAMKNIQRQQLMSLRGASMLGGGKALGILGGINEQGNQAVGNLDAADASARMQNQKFAIGVNNAVGGVKRSLYDENVRKPYEVKRDQMMQQLGAGNQNIVGGADRLIAGALGGANSGAFGGNSGSGTQEGGDGVSTDWLMRNNPYAKKRF